MKRYYTNSPSLLSSFSIWLILKGTVILVPLPLLRLVQIVNSKITWQSFRTINHKLFKTASLWVWLMVSAFTYFINLIYDIKGLTSFYEVVHSLSNMCIRKCWNGVPLIRFINILLIKDVAITNHLSKSELTFFIKFHWIPSVKCSKNYLFTSSKFIEIVNRWCRRCLIDIDTINYEIC